MAPFDSSKAYAPQTPTFFDDGREFELLHFIYGKPDIDSIRGCPLRVLAAVDEFARTRKYLMNVGEDKGRIVTGLIQEVKPRVMVELGGYVGYSCILFGDAVRKAGGTRYFSLERNPSFAAVAASLVDLAGLADIVKVVVGSSDVSISRLHAAGDLARIDLLFLDHYKPAYTTDLKLCEELRLITSGSVLAADNVIKPGNPPYLEYVRSSVVEKRAAAAGEKKSSGEGDGGGPDEKSVLGDGIDPRFAPRTVLQYEKRQGRDMLNTTVKGNPNLVYESMLVESFEPTGVPVSYNFSMASIGLKERRDVCVWRADRVLCIGRSGDYQMC
ncbi:catechol O-methyltransferase [Lepidopterella palustris CBS 459.81]|uniref:catechol O-methyltransferase n=1 Tax=Lepidopterella palustris CBS 459.81 TaxID=1314670 RepID=A0A8E2DZN6_9PEZI|nr:catechol O-methyltransferase [Lepidopterella palustris CBS 459.81]